MKENHHNDMSRAQKTTTNVCREKRKCIIQFVKNTHVPQWQLSYRFNGTYTEKINTIYLSVFFNEDVMMSLESAFRNCSIWNSWTRLHEDNWSKQNWMVAVCSKIVSCNYVGQRIIFYGSVKGETTSHQYSFEQHNQSLQTRHS